MSMAIVLREQYNRPGRGNENSENESFIKNPPPRGRFEPALFLRCLIRHRAIGLIVRRQRISSH